MAIADGGELIVLAPGVVRFGEDLGIDALIRRYGYRGTPATLAAMHDDPELAASLLTAAHLIHGSSEGRFRIVYCTDPAVGGLTEAEVNEVGYAWRLLPEESERLGVTATTAAVPATDSSGVPFEFIPNPALGLWASAPKWHGPNRHGHESDHRPVVDDDDRFRTVPRRRETPAVHRLAFAAARSVWAWAASAWA